MNEEKKIIAEWVVGEPGEAWSIGCYGPAADAFGRAQAPFIAGRKLPTVSWLSRDFLRHYSCEKPVDWGLLDDDEVWQQPVVRETFPASLRVGVAFVHAHRERLYRINRSLPATLCHLDVWPQNLFRRPDGQIVLIDWSFVGVGAIGEDAGNLVPDAALDHFVAAAELPQLEQVVFDGYLRGLQEAGWDGDPRMVQLGMWSSAVKYDWLAPFTLAQAGLARQYRYGGGDEIDATFKFRGNEAWLCYSTLAGRAKRSNSTVCDSRSEDGYDRRGEAGEDGRFLDVAVVSTVVGSRSVPFNVSANAYDRFMGRYSIPLAPLFADFAGTTSGQRVLDVGCGPGALTTELVRRVGPAAVVAVDPSSSFVSAVRRRHPGVEVHLGEAERLPLDDDYVDSALAQLVVHFMADPIAGLHEMARVTSPGGVLAACVLDYAEGGGPLSVFWQAAQQLDPAVDGESAWPGTRRGPTWPSCSGKPA